MTKGSLQYPRPEQLPEAAVSPAGPDTRSPTWHRWIRALINDQRIRYLATGGITAGIYYVIFSTGWLLFGERIPYMSTSLRADIMAIFANFTSAILTYPLYRIVVFRASGPWLKGFVRFYAVFVWGMVLSIVGLPLLIEVFHIPVLLSQAIILVVSPLINYQLHKLWAFRKKTP